MNNSMRDHELLTQFYVSMQTWVDAGTPGDHVFERTVGLCGNLHTWLREQGTPAKNLGLHWLLKQQFEEAGLHSYCPFNASSSDYLAEQCDLGTLYENQARLDWIRTHATYTDPNQLHLEGF